MFLLVLIMNCFCLLNFLCIDYLLKPKLFSSVISFNTFRYSTFSTNFTSKQLPQESLTSSRVEWFCSGIWPSCCLVISLSHHPGDSLLYQFISLPCFVSACVFLGLCPHFDGISWERMCEVNFWRSHNI